MPSRTFALFCCLVAALPSAAASAPNAVDVDILGPSNAVSNCQLAILVMPTLLLAIEDGLGLATLSSSRPLEVHLPETTRARASCEIDVGELDITGAPPTTVTGATAISPAAPYARAGGLGSHVGEASAFASCQRIILVGAVVVGGTAFGLPFGIHPFLDVYIETSSATATCDVDVAVVRHE